MLTSRQMQREMTKWLFVEKPRYACKTQVPEPFFMDTQNGDMLHRKPLEGLDGPRNGEESEVVQVFVASFGFVWPYVSSFCKICPNEVK